ncbi:DUF1617 family protein [Lactiplantibacillus plantarum]|uniref:DUF1617 family protein n=1 Tax=Lactiplantibacillus plantarum TaxID=1590 RepID=UPI001FCB8F5A|nr:DUF1617 family protein [Lactiplantibacillus plantarum]MCJ2382882.1 DUF1617 family protein [Lactiplantibacillus plantarum]
MKTTVSFKNDELVGIANTLGQFKLKGKASLGRSALIRKLATKQEEYISDRVGIQQKYFEADKEGNLKTLDDGSEKLIPKPELADDKDPSKLGKDHEKKLNSEMNELSSDLSNIDFSEYSARFKALKASLDDYPYELDKGDAVAYSRVYDQLEEAFSKSSKEEE